MNTNDKTILGKKWHLQSLLAIAVFFVLPALAQPGALDPTFGNDGNVVTSVTNAQYADFPRSIQVQHQATIAIAILL